MSKNKYKNKKQKSFFFSDYIESEITYQKRNINSIKVSSNRTTVLFFVFFSLILIFSIKIIYLSLYPQKNLLSVKVYNNFVKERGDILDRNENILASNINIYDAAIRPSLVKDKKKLIINLKLIFPSINSSKIMESLLSNKYFYIKKRLTEGEYTKLWLLGNKAIDFPKRQNRIYPQKNLFSHIIGQIDDNNTGISGLEKSFNDSLKSSSLALTVDSNLQYLIREELINAQSNFNNKGSAAILMDVQTGEVLSLISLPDYDLNERASIKDKNFLNKITLGVYELGSVFKTFTIAAALENNIINTNTIFKNLKNSINCDKYTISEHDKLPKNLSTEQILIRSSNIGAVRIAQKLGVEKYKNFLNSLELLDQINFDLKEIGTPLPFKWGKCKLATTSYGHGITTTPLQLAKAYAILGNGGYKIEPFILKKKKNYLTKKEQVVSSKTSASINSMLRKVVSLNEGTANFANIEGFDIGGKTGSADKYNSTEKLNTFVALFPSSRPKYVLLVILDEPKAAPSFVYDFPPSDKFPNGYKHKGENRNTSGWNAVVVSGKIIEKIGPILAIKNLQTSKNF